MHSAFSGNWQNHSFLFTVNQQTGSCLSCRASDFFSTLWIQWNFDDPGNCRCAKCCTCTGTTIPHKASLIYCLIDLIDLWRNHWGQSMSQNNVIKIRHCEPKEPSPVVPGGHSMLPPLIYRSQNSFAVIISVVAQAVSLPSTISFRIRRSLELGVRHLPP